MIGRRFRRVAASTVLASVVVFMLSSCSDDGSEATTGVKVVAAFYPLAWAARQVGGEAVTVEDLTPASAEAHDIQLTARQRADVQDATLILLFGKGFQQELEDAARDTSGRAVDLLEGLSLLPSNQEELDADPHVWLDPVLMREIVGKIGEALAGVDATNVTAYRRRASVVQEQLAGLGASYRTTLGTCALNTMVTTHEAFGYLAKRYGLTQLGLTGLTPEAEPSAAQLRKVRELARDKTIAAIFVEATDEGRRIGGSVARDAGVPALDLNTLESDPQPEEYLSQMRENLTDLKKGLRCS